MKSKSICVWVVGVLLSACICQSAFAGFIIGWGDNTEGQATPPGGNDFVAIAAGGFHSLALIPEPATLLLLGLGAVMLRRKQ